MSNKAFASNGGGTDSYYAHLAVNKSRLKEYDGSPQKRKVYLSGGSEFQIELFNPTDETVGVKVSVNGKPISQSRLVLYPGQRAWLERDFVSRNKFKFITYEIDENDPEAVAATEGNGKIEVEFYRQKREASPWLTASPWTAVTWVNTTAPAWDIASTSTAANPIPTDCHQFTCRSDMLSLGSESSATNRAAYGANCGRVETGFVGRSENRSSQEFVDAVVDFEWLPFKTELMQILPLSRKALTTMDIPVRRYCSNCGHKLKPNFKYCPSCGTKVD